MGRLGTGGAFGSTAHAGHDGDQPEGKVSARMKLACTRAPCCLFVLKMLCVASNVRATQGDADGRRHALL